MKIGISTAAFSSRPAEEGLDIAKEYGADCIEANLRTFYEYRPEFAKKYCLQAKGLVKYVQPSPHNFERQLFDGDRRVRGDGLYWLDQILRSAQLLGAEKYILRGGYLGECHTDVCDLRQSLNEINALCSRYGVALCVENAVYSLYSKPDDFGEISQSAEGICAVVNMAAAKAARFPYETFVCKTQGKLAAVKVCNFDLSGNFCPLDCGVRDFKEIISYLKDAGFDGDLLIGNDCGGEDGLKRSIEYLKSLI